MSIRIQKNLPFLQVLCIANQKQINSIIHFADKDLVLAISECIKNILDGNVPIQLSALKKYRYLLQQLSVKKLSVLKQKVLYKKLNKQFYSTLLSPIFDYIQEQ